jgi:catechol 2,3-dioxygenase-like lactoylglutathione lyase family enzyme
MSNGPATNVKQLVPLLMVRDIQLSIDFYVRGIGFEMTNKWLDNERLRWCWLQVGGAALMLQEYVPDEHHVSIPSKDPGEGVGFYFTCDDALAIYHAVLINGLSPSEPFVGNKMWVVGLTDPDGYKIFFESSTDVPEETTYSGWSKSNKS